MKKQKKKTGFLGLGKGLGNGSFCKLSKRLTKLFLDFNIVQFPLVLREHLVAE